MANSKIMRQNHKLIQSGGFTISGASSSGKTYTVNFDTPFNGTPTVVMFLTASYNRRIDLQSVSTTGFVAVGFVTSGSADIWANWIAVGE